MKYKDITEIRQQLGLSQPEFAKAMCVSTWTVKYWDRQLKPPPPMATKLARVLLRYPWLSSDQPLV